MLAALLAGMAVNSRHRKSPAELRRARGEADSALDESSKKERVEEAMDRWFGLSTQPSPRTEGTLLELDMSSESLAFERAVMRECPAARTLSTADLEEFGRARKWNPEKYLYVHVPVSCRDVLRELLEQRRKEMANRRWKS